MNGLHPVNLASGPFIYSNSAFEMHWWLVNDLDAWKFTGVVFQNSFWHNWSLNPSSNLAHWCSRSLAHMVEIVLFTETVISQGMTVTVPNAQSISSEAPQGTCLGSLLLLIYLNNLPKVIGNANFYTYGDGTYASKLTVFFSQRKH